MQHSDYATRGWVWGPGGRQTIRSILGPSGRASFHSLPPSPCGCWLHGSRRDASFRTQLPRVAARGPKRPRPRRHGAAAGSGSWTYKYRTPMAASSFPLLPAPIAHGRGRRDEAGRSPSPGHPARRPARATVHAAGPLLLPRPRHLPLQVRVMNL